LRHEATAKRPKPIIITAHVAGSGAAAAKSKSEKLGVVS
jgi:hypothetical protein